MRICSKPPLLSAFLETIAFVVIGILGLKLLLTLPCHFDFAKGLCGVLENETADMYMSIFTVSLFVIPILTAYFFDIPKKSEKE